MVPMVIKIPHIEKIYNAFENKYLPKKNSDSKFFGNKKKMKCNYFNFYFFFYDFA